MRENCGWGDGQRHGLEPEEVKAEFIGSGVWYRYWHGGGEGEEGEEEEGDGEGERSGLHLLCGCFFQVSLVDGRVLWKEMVSVIERISEGKDEAGRAEREREKKLCNDLATEVK